ncbi:MAG: pantoate--beta-alanine ligase [Myxococcota bacterium]|nr:pantoate--beta-alanine ligase [Myxococcota bacterium]
MQQTTTIAELREIVREQRSRGNTIGFVPTMGALHAGHLSLIEFALQRSDYVVSSIFVNPKQFGPNEDLESYPRQLQIDVEKLESVNCDLLFSPSASQIYPDTFETQVRLTTTTQGLCGDYRPGHFDGVTTVVLKLLNLVTPDVAVFGKKDYQQLTVIRRMVEDLGLNVEIVGAPLIRDHDGLALSSRNAYLSHEERSQALSLSRALKTAKQAFLRGETKSSKLIRIALDVINNSELRLEYLELRNSKNLAPTEEATQDSLMLVAAHIGTTRLIDNIEFVST